MITDDLEPKVQFYEQVTGTRQPGSPAARRPGGPAARRPVSR
jgi:hypothetical protein